MRFLLMDVFRSAFLALLALLIHPNVLDAAIFYGRVLREDGSAVTRARVTLFTPDLAFFRELRSDEAGFFSFVAVPPGSYRAGAASPGLEYSETTLVVAASDSDLTFALRKEANPGAWEVIGRFTHDTFGGSNSGVLLPDSRILYCHDTVDPAILDPLTGRIDLPPPSPRIQSCHATRLLQDGRVIYVGGADTPVYGPGTRQVKTFDPATSQWQMLPDLSTERWYPSLVQLPDGELLAVGGGGTANPIRVSTSEVMNPMSRQWSAVGEIALGNEVSPTVLLYTGEVLMTHRPPQLWSPITRQWRRAADFVQGNRMPNGDHSDHEVVLLPDGRVVAVGYKPFAPSASQSMAEVYDPVANQWTMRSSSAPLRSRASILMLPDKQVLVLGGFKEDAADPTPVNRWGYVSLAELYDAKGDKWRRVTPMSIAREYHAMPLLIPDGRVVVTGGEGAPGNEPDVNVIEVFQPPYLFRGVRPEITSLSRTAVERGGRLTLAIDKTNAPTAVVLLSTGATTHFLDAGGSRYVELAFTMTGNVVTALIPTDPNRLPIGFYILFVMVDDIPSVGRIIRVDAQQPARSRPVRR